MVGRIYREGPALSISTRGVARVPIDGARTARRSRRLPTASVPQPTTWRIIASSFVKSIGFVMWVVKPAARLRRISSSIP